ncbi:MAG: CRISPR-associated protein Cas4 [Dehalococcoidia bacterium]|nr:CRISPR-associated protein Cas4 [Dehalococcoidia bacterium]
MTASEKAAKRGTAPPPPALLTPPLTLTVSDIKQFVYCPRVVFFTYTLPPRRRPATYKMEEGRIEHDHVAGLEQRRGLRAYGLSEGERLFNVSLHSARLALSGKLDMVILAGDEVIPVDFKNSGGGIGLNHRYQLASYALLVEDKWRKPVRRGFVYLVPLKMAREVVISPNMRLFARQVMHKIREMIESETMPPSARQKARCRDCEYRNFCNDVC